MSTKENNKLISVMVAPVTNGKVGEWREITLPEPAKLTWTSHRRKALSMVKRLAARAVIYVALHS